MANLTKTWTNSIAGHIDAIAEALCGFEKRVRVGPNRRLEIAYVVIHADGSGEVGVVLSAVDQEHPFEGRQTYQKVTKGLDSYEMAENLMRISICPRHPELPDVF